VDAWAAELKVPQEDLERLPPVAWQDESIPGVTHALFTWWTRTPAWRMNPPQSPFTKGEEQTPPQPLPISNGGNGEGQSNGGAYG